MKKKELKSLYERFLCKDTPESLERFNSSQTDDKQSASQRLSHVYCLLGSFEWYFHKNDNLFFDYMKKSIFYKKEDLFLCKEGNPDFKTYPSLTSELFPDLCTGNEVIIRDFFSLIDDHFDYDEKPSSHPTPWMYRCLVVLTLGRMEDQFPHFLEKLKKGYSTKRWGKLMPYADLIEAIWHRDESAFHEALRVISNTHKSMVRGIFENQIEYQLLCLWGIGLCQLARIKGMHIDFDHEYIPRELIGEPR